MRSVKRQVEIDEQIYQLSTLVAGDFSLQEVLDKLAVVLEREGRLTSAIIDAASDAPHSLTVRKLFGSLPAAYARLGYVAVPKPAEGSLIAKARRASAAAQAKTSLGLGSDG